MTENNNHIPFYRQYWVVGMMLVLVPVLGTIIGITIFLTGGAYKQNKTGYVQVSATEKLAVIIAAFLLHFLLFLAIL